MFIFKVFIMFILKQVFVEMTESTYRHHFHHISLHSSAPWLRGEEYTELANSLEEIYV